MFELLNCNPEDNNLVVVALIGLQIIVFKHE